MSLSLEEKLRVVNEAELEYIGKYKMGNVNIEENIRILEQGITLQQFSGMQEQLAIDGSMDAYHK